MKHHNVTPIEAIALQSFARKVNGDKAFTDTLGNECGPRALIGQGEYLGRMLLGLDFGYQIGEPKPKPGSVPWSKIAALLGNRVNDETMAKIVSLTLQGRFESLDKVKADLLSPLKAPTLKDGRLSVKYLNLFTVIEQEVAEVG
tara:strand:+ start:2300 stop:2731 length:432 start_codon:yes stop_codon:yes gene_type:complete